MLIRFTVENFMSFRKRAAFTMGASKILRHQDHVTKVKKEKLLKLALLYGANASGKTNFVRAMHLAKGIILRGVDSVNFEKKYFRLDDASKTEPCVFQFDIYAGGTFYSYGFAISHVDRTIEEEWLYAIEPEEKCVFLRSKDAQGHTSVELAAGLTPEERKRLTVYAEDLNNNKMGKTLFLSEIFSRSKAAGGYLPYHHVRNWVKNLIIIFPDSQYSNLHELCAEEKTQEQFARFLEFFDTGIVGIKNVNIEFDKAFDNIDDASRETIKVDLLRELSPSTEPMSESQKQAVLQTRANRFVISQKEGELVVNNVLTNHGNENDLFSFDDESDGTRRLFDLIPLLVDNTEGSVIVIDELDRSFHTMLARKFLELYVQTSGCKSQLIATTHDANLLDLDFVRQDEIWFVERDNNHNSVLVPLDTFKVRFDKDIEKDYLLGRYGAIPLFSDKLLVEADHE